MKKTDKARNTYRRGSAARRNAPEPLDDALRAAPGGSFADPDDFSIPDGDAPHGQPAYAGLADPGDLSPETVLALFDSPRPGASRGKNGPGNGRRAIPQEEIFDFFGFRKGRKRKVERILSELTAQGRLIRLKGPAYALPERLSRVAGRISIQRQGMGFVRPEAGAGGRSASSAPARGKAGNGSAVRAPNRGEDIYVHPSQLGGAWDGDRVLVALLPGQSGKNPEGRVIEVLERSLKEAAVVLLPEMVREGGQGKRLARPLDARLSGYLLVDLSALASRVNADETVLVSLLPESEQPGDGVIRARAVTVLGAQKSLPLHERLVKAAHGIHAAFPPEVLEECALLPNEPDPDEFFPPGESRPERREFADSGSPRPSAGAAQSSEGGDAASPAALPGNEPLQTEAPTFSTADSWRGQADGQGAVQPAGRTAAQTPKTARRRDLRQLGFVTIDGEDARDFDDAIHVERGAGGYVLRVAIADVAHYVRPGSALDREALERGNSCYFPASVEPMLPEALSNGLCSLKPRVPRLAMVAEIAFDGSGEPGKTAFYPAVIESAGRLTYAQAHQALEEEDETARAELREHLPMLALASELARLLMRQRGSRGSLDFDLPEPKVLLNGKGEVQALQFSQRHFSNRLIEEFMIAANEAVARHLESIGASFLYRAHPAPDPDKLADFFTTLERNGLLPDGSHKPGGGGPGRPEGAYPELSPARVPGGGRGASGQAWNREGGRNSRHSSGAAKSAYGNGRKTAQVSRAGQSGQSGRGGPSAADLQKILARVRGTAEEYVVNRLLLRSMMQARYTPEQEGHFGLASEAYCHFTSPIRRYADLVVHRVLRRSLGLGDRLPAREQLFGIADSLNESERNAIDAEREIQKISAALFLSDQVGEEFEATVAGMSSFGLFVELKSVPVEGFLPVEELEDDFYRLDSERQMLIGLRGGRIYRLGQELRVVLDKADPARQEIRFFLSPESHPEAIGRRGKPLKGPARGATGRKPAPRGKGGRQREKFRPGAVRVRKK